MPGALKQIPPIASLPLSPQAPVPNKNKNKNKKKQSSQTGGIVCFCRCLAVWGSHRDTGQKQIKWLVKEEKNGGEKSQRQWMERKEASLAVSYNCAEENR